jgi:hypothetical protein
MTGGHVAILVDGKYKGWTHIDKILDRLYGDWDWVNGTFNETSEGWRHKFVDGTGAVHTLEILDL